MSLHIDIASDLRNRIQGGEFRPGSSLPSESQLCQRYRVSRGTIRTALAHLRSEGFIHVSRGSRPVVLDVAIDPTFSTLVSFSAWATQAGYVLGHRTVGVTRHGASPFAADLLGIKEGDPVIDVIRLCSLDGTPTMVERSSFVPRYGILIFDRIANPPAIPAGGDEPVLDYSTHSFDAVESDQLDCELLDVRLGAPLFRERRLASNREGEPIAYSEDRYNPRIFKLTIEQSRLGEPRVGRAARIGREIRDTE